MSQRRGSPPADTAIGRVALGVGDLDRAVAFYEAIVGLRTREHDGATAVLGTDDAGLLVISERPYLPPRAADEAGLFHVAFRVPSRAALGDALARVEDRWTLTGASDHLVSEALYLDDPEGNGIELYWDRPKAAWPLDDEGRVAMATRPLDLEALRETGRDRDDVPAGTDVGHVHLEVSDLGATRQFYTEGLGLRVRQTYGDEAVFLAAGDYHHHVGANVWNRRAEPADGRGLDWVEMRVSGAAALEGARDRLRDLGWDTPNHEGGFAVRDPDGIELRVRHEGDTGGQ